MNTVRDLDCADYDELVLWIQDEAKQAADKQQHGDGSMDMDAYVNAKAMKATETDDEWEE